MARATKEEREAAQAEQSRRYELEEQQRLQDMPLTILRLMARSSAAGLSSYVTTNADGTISITFNDKYGDPIKLCLSSSESMVRAVECDIELKEFEVAELKRKMALRESALAKLTQEDREALGL